MYVCMYVCMCVYVRHAQKIAKHAVQFPFKLRILFKKNISTSWAPKHSVSYTKLVEYF